MRVAGNTLCSLDRRGDSEAPQGDARERSEAKRERGEMRERARERAAAQGGVERVQRRA